MKKSTPVFFLTIWAILCTGCQRLSINRPAPTSHVVTEITITRESDDLTHRYTGQDSMGQILSYLRRLDPYGKVEEDPEVLSGENYQITVTLSDGRQTVYRQVAMCYFCGADQHWQQIDPEAAKELPLLFAELDESPAAVAIPEINAYRAFCSDKYPVFP